MNNYTSTNDSETTNEESGIRLGKYKTPNQPGVSWINKSNVNNLCELDKFLENEKQNNANDPWSKLDKTTKLVKMRAFAVKYSEEHELSEEEHDKLIVFFRDCLDRKKLQRVKEVIYDKKTGEIKDIPALFYTKPTQHFTLKNMEKHLTTLKMVPPKTRTTTIRSKNKTSDKTGE
jgi:hypothetical protein